MLHPLEAARLLRGLAGRQLRPLEPAWLVDHVLRIHAGDGWVVQRAAFEAALRRAAQVRADDLRVAQRPGPRQPLGPYRVRRRGRGGALPWRTWVASLDPLCASCDCPDFLANGLGVCPHVLAALMDIAERPRVRKKAERIVAQRQPRLVWDAVRPLTGRDESWWRLRVTAHGAAPAFARGWTRRGSWLYPPRGARQREQVLRSLTRYVERRPSQVSPAARAVIEAETARLDRRCSGRDLSGAMRALGSLRRPLYPYQREGVRQLVARGRLLLADDMGLGKTAQAIGACHVLAESGRVRRGLLLVPAPLKGQWKREWEAFTDLPLTVVEGTPAARRALYDSTSEGFLVVNYELLLRDREALASWAPDLVVLDEAQRIKNPATKTARAVKSLRSRYRLALTGTPMENRFAELASIVEWIDERAIEPRWRLAPVHGDASHARHLDTLRTRLEGCLLRRRREEILGELPPRVDSHVPVAITPAQASVHRRHEREVARLARIRKRRPLTPPEELELIKHLTQQRIVSNALAQRDFEDVWPTIVHTSPTPERLASLHGPKLAAFREVIESLVVSQGRTIVVFSQWRRMLRLAWWAVHDLLEREGLRAAFFTGAESLRSRDKSVVELHDDPRTRILFSTDAGGVGLNLQRAASACVHLEPAWNPAVTEQRVARIHRLGQDQPIDVVHLVTVGSIDEKIAGLSSAKRALFTALFDSDASEAGGESASLLERLAAQDAVGVDDVGPDDVPPTREAAAPARGPRSCVGAKCAPEPEPARPPRRTERDVAGLFAALSVERDAAGGVVISAPEHVAADLAALFEGMASLVSSRAA